MRKVKWKRRSGFERVSGVGSRAFGLAVGTRRISLEYCMGVPVYPVRGCALVRIVHLAELVI